MSPFCPHCGAPDYGTPYCPACQRPLDRSASSAVRPPAAAPGPPPVVLPAGFFRRFAALLFDWILLSLASDLVLLAYRLGSGAKKTAVEMETALGISLVLFFLYFTILIGEGGQTLGKKLLKVKVLRSDGSPVTYGRAFLRALGYFVSCFFLTWLGFLWAIWDRRKQAWHDKIADTIVVKG
ncbi:MAG: RDD family protein [bacterium]|nr:MAG: RDD family protein [bacterium]